MTAESDFYLKFVIQLLELLGSLCDLSAVIIQCMLLEIFKLWPTLTPSLYPLLSVLRNSPLRCTKLRSSKPAHSSSLCSRRMASIASPPPDKFHRVRDGTQPGKGRDTVQLLKIDAALRQMSLWQTSARRGGKQRDLHDLYLL